MPQPNLFLIGAPKCGTSALYAYLREHPQVFMSRVKEPHYFCYDFPGLRRFPTESEYLSLFAGAQPHHRIVGEATSRYLYSAAATTAIERQFDNARYIVMLRDPVELVHSLHGQLLYQFCEDEVDFERAWRLQEMRRIGKHVPRSCSSVSELMYGDIAMLGLQIKRLFQTVPRERIHVIFYDDFRDDLSTVYGKVLEFLGLPNDGRTDFPRVNPHKTYRAPWLAKLVVDPPFPLSSVKQGLKQTFGWKETTVGRWVYARLTRPEQRTAMSVAMHLELREFFLGDIELLEDLTERSLPQWKKTTSVIRQAA